MKNDKEFIIDKFKVSKMTRNLDQAIEKIIRE